MEQQHPLAVANYFVQRSFETGSEMTLMKAIKLVYISHGWCLGFTDNPLIPEAVQAWQYGPVVESVYHGFKHYAKDQILSPAYAMEKDGAIAPYKVLDPEVEKFLNDIWTVYGNYDGLQLSTLTHQNNTPWDIVYNQQLGKKTRAAIIPNDLIRSHYKEKINESSRKRVPA